jgi:hypothetical protein
VSAGPRLEFLHEHDHTLFARWPFLKRADDGPYRLPEGTPSLPLMYSLLASAPWGSVAPFSTVGQLRRVGTGPVRVVAARSAANRRR